MNILVRKVKTDDFDIILSLANQLYETEQPFDKNIKNGYYDTEKGRKKLKRYLEALKNVTTNNFIHGII